MSLANRINRVAHDDRRARIGFPHGRHRKGSSDKDNIDPEARKLGSDCAKALVLSLGESIVDYEVLAFDVAELTHSLCEPGIEARFQRRRPSAACNKTNT